jgi:ElaB/YqjD/DUF883 family membrane-anchored ribosome-binding protein
MAEEGPMTDRFDDKRVNEALELLEEMAKDKRTELQEMIDRKYLNLRSAARGTAGRIQQDVVGAYHRGKDKVVGVAEDLDENVHKNPWPYIGGTALGCLLLGYFLGRSKKS